MYNVVTIDKQGNSVTKVELEDKVILYIGNSIIDPNICQVQAYDVFNSVNAFSWNQKDFYSLYGALSEKVASYLDGI